jgi:PAS domain S-box-containing protein
MTTKQSPAFQVSETRILSVLSEQINRVNRSRDRFFLYVVSFQWLFALGLALFYSPHSWAGAQKSTHVHVWYAIVLGAALNLPVYLLVWRRPGSALTRHVIAAVQMLWSALLIHLTGGRIETHFHVFGSLAFIAFYRDWRLLVTATVVVAGDHLLRGLVWPQSVYGISNPEWWRFLEHAFWVVFEDAVLFLGVIQAQREMRQLAHRQVELEELNALIDTRVQQRTAELVTSREQYRGLVETLSVVPWELRAGERAVSYVGPQIQGLLGHRQDQFLRPGFWESTVHPEHLEQVKQFLRRQLKGRGEQEIECRLQHKDGRDVWVRVISSAHTSADAAVLRGIIIDITDRRRLETELQQAQKLESMGRLAAGIAHEINTPIQYITDNTVYLRGGYEELLELVQGYRDALARLPVSDEESAALARAEEEADLPYLQENAPRAFDSLLDGARRVAGIVHSMKAFAHPSTGERHNANLNDAIASTVTLSRSEWKYVAELETDFGELPPVPCYLGELNQAVLNMIVNAAHAIGDVVRDSGAKGRLTVRTRALDDQVVISISDTGGGIPAHIRDKIFDPFFTTKEVGKGTGQGLAIARAVVVDKHRGSISVESELGKGTTFHVRLPLAAEEAAA